MNLSSAIARGNMALSACSAQFTMVDVFAASESHAHSPSFRQTASLFKQVVALCSQTPYNCSIAEPCQSLN